MRDEVSWFYMLTGKLSSVSAMFCWFPFIKTPATFWNYIVIKNKAILGFAGLIL